MKKKKKKEKAEIKIKTQKSKKIQKPIRPTQSPQPQRKLSPPNPKPLWPPRPQISLSQLQQLLRQLP